jgi:hypothetical protein
MGLPLPLYAKIKDRYCLLYLGFSWEYVVQLSCFLPLIEESLPGLDLHICCRDEVFHHFNNPKIFPHAEFAEKKEDFAHVRELKCNMDSHPVEDLLKESKVPCKPVVTPTVDLTIRCVICPDATLPTKPLESRQIEEIKGIARLRHFVPEVSENLEGAGWVIGPENGVLFLAASKGIKTSLVPTGVGTKLYQKMFPNGEVLNIV